MNLLPIIKLSWKNIWRSKTRSSVVITAVVLGTWAGIFMSAFMYGLSMQYIKIQLDNFTSHIQIHTSEYKEEKLPEFYIPDADSLISKLKTKPFVTGITGRSVIGGLAASGSNSYSVTILGIDPETEKTVTRLHTFMSEGDYFETNSRNPILIGEKLAKRLSVGLRSKVVLNFQDVEGNISAGAFRVSGIFKSPNSVFDEANVLVLKQDLNRLIAKPDAVHEIAIIVDDFNLADQYAQELVVGNNLAVESWSTLSPALSYTNSMVGTTLYIVMTIILVALTFGIVNTMLMAVMERQHELGMLMAVGVNKARTFFMILFETLFLSLFGAPFGIALAWVSITLMANTGIDLSAWAQGFEMYGMGTTIYPELDNEYYFAVGGMIFITTLIASLYPSYKALKLNPVEAIRKI